MPYVKKVAAIAVFQLSFGAVITAQVARPVAPPVAPRIMSSGVVTSGGQNGQGMLHGRAIDKDFSPLPNAKVRLRNLASGVVEKVSTANQLGEFTFVVTPDIPYVVEVVDQAGQILAIGNIVSAQVGEVAGAVVQVPVRLPALAGLLGNTAGSVVSAASGAGITALQSTFEPPPASPEN
jgi:hypothetical protein